MKIARIRLILCPQTWFFTADRLERVSESWGVNIGVFFVKKQKIGGGAQERVDLEVG